MFMYSMTLHESHKNRVFPSRFRGVSKPTIILDTTVELVSKTTTLGSYIISHFVHQARRRKETYSWVGFVNSCKTKINCKKMQLSENNLGTSPHRLAVLAIRSAKTLMVQYQLVGSCCFCLCKIVHL